MKWRTIGGWRTAVIALLGTSILALLVLAGAIANRMSLLDDAELGRLTFTEMADADDLVAGAAIPTLLLFLATGVTWIVWQWRVASNLQTVRRTEARFSPGWSIGAWFIPCASSIIPGLILMDLWRASGDTPPSVDDPSPTVDPPQRPWAIVGWWITFVVGSVMLSSIRFSEEPANQTLDEFRSTQTTWLVGNLVTVGAGLFAIIMISQLTRRADALGALRPTPAQWAPSAPPGWHPDPSGQHGLRFWDGVAWTDQVMSAAPPAPAPAPPGLTQPSPGQPPPDPSGPNRPFDPFG